jgi:hypothetical protein
MLKRVAVLLALDQSPGMALEAVGHVAAAMGTVAFPHQTPHRVVIRDGGRQTERRLKHMACGAQRGSCCGEDKFSMRVPGGAGRNLRESAPVFRMTRQTRVLLPNKLLMEHRH